jgi:hypothetical protein
MGCGASTDIAAPAATSAAPTKQTTQVRTANTDVADNPAEQQQGKSASGYVKVEQWGKSTFAQFDANSDGQLSKAELLAALKALPRSKPKTMPPGAKFMSVDAMVEAMDADSDGSIDLSEWLDNLHKCAGLVAALAENVNADGLLESYKPEEQRHSE